jgi:aminoglycoside phosphotransferase (APT) family kinase protein
VQDDRATIRRLLGDVPVQPLGTGLDHRVYAVGDTLVARFGQCAAREAALLTAIAPRLPLVVPVPIAVDADAGCLVQPRLPGMPLLYLPRASRRAFAPHLLAFANALHALSPGVDVPKDDAALEEWLVEARATWAAVRDKVPASRREAIEAVLATSAPMQRATRVLIHGDLGAEHVLVDAGRITGVIDWSDAVIGDPALDHGRLMRDLGPIAGDGEQAYLYAVCTALEDLAFGLETGRDIYRKNALDALEELTGPC